MNERIKQLAEQAGMIWSHPYDFWAADNEDLERFAELVRQDLYQDIGKSVITQIQAARKMEREACAKLCELTLKRSATQHYASLTYSNAANDCAAAIRGRTE